MKINHWNGICLAYDRHLIMATIIISKYYKHSLNLNVKGGM